MPREIITLQVGQCGNKGTLVRLDVSHLLLCSDACVGFV
jgi:hypothetical protein